MKRPAGEGTFVIPNADGKGYGFFCLFENNANACLSYLPFCKDEVLRGSLLITLYENLLNRRIPAELYMEAMLDYLPGETNFLLFSAALGYIGNCQRLYPSDPEKLEQVLWRIVTTAEQPQRRLLSENDYISLSYDLAIQMPDKADEIVATQQARITNPDRKRQYAFISPSVSPQKEVRDSVFASLLVAGNRRVEPWALLSGHTSSAARKEVDDFFAAHPDYPVLLSNKVRQQADHLYRLYD